MVSLARYREKSQRVGPAMSYIAIEWVAESRRRGAIFSSPATYSHLRSRLHHRGGKVLLLAAQVRPDFSFLFRVRSTVGRSVGFAGSVGRLGCGVFLFAGT